MNQTTLHLLITHLPIFGSILGAIVLMYALWTKSPQTIIAAYIILVISSVGAVVSYLTGEAAEETAEKISEVTKSTIEEHEDAAIFALVFLSILGVTSIIGMILTSKKSRIAMRVAFINLLIAVFSFTVVARTGYLGGHIRHPELNPSYQLQEEKDEKVRDHD